MTLKMLLAVAYAILAAPIVITLRRDPHPSIFVTFLWALLYVTSVVIPSWWAHRTRVILKELGVTARKEVSLIAAYPVMVGMLTLLITLTLVQAVAGR